MNNFTNEEDQEKIINICCEKISKHIQNQNENVLINCANDIIQEMKNKNLNTDLHLFECGIIFSEIAKRIL